MVEQAINELLRHAGVPALILVFGAIVWERLSQLPKLTTRTEDHEKRISRLEGADRERDPWD
jgi:hypothetical protein